MCNPQHGASVDLLAPASLFLNSSASESRTNHIYVQTYVISTTRSCRPS